MSRPSLLDRVRRFYRLPDTPDLAWTRTKVHQRRVEQVKTGWILSGLIMLAMDNLAAVLGMTLFSAFMSFAFLERDEEEEQG